MPITLVSFSFMYSRKDKQEIVLFIYQFFFRSPTCPHLTLFLVLFLCLSLSFSSAVFPVFLQGKVCSSIKNIQGSLTFNFLFVVLFYPLPVCHTRSPPSPSHSHSFLLFFFVISLLSAHNPWFYLKLLPSEHYGSFCKEISSFLALHLQTFQIWSEHSVLVSWCCNGRQLTRFWNTLSLEVCLWGVLLIKEMCLIWQLTWCENLWHFSMCVWLLEWDKWPCLCLREQVAKSAWWPATHTLTHRDQ